MVQAGISHAMSFNENKESIYKLCSHVLELGRLKERDCMQPIHISRVWAGLPCPECPAGKQSAVYWEA